MPVALHRDVRKILEGVVREARKAAEEGARTALRELGVADARVPSWLDEERRALRVRLRAHARTLADPLDTGEPARMPRLVREIAYAHWHRALFARFLVENGLLVDVAAGNARVSREDLAAIGEDEGKDVAEVAAEYAQPMLPEIFPADDPVLALRLPAEARQRIADLVEGLPAQTFKADDALGWTYQFWQADRKEEVNRSEVKIGADELPAVTQLFTEDYMVLFLLENTLGAWWAGKRLAEDPDLARNAADEDELRRKLSPEGYSWTYLRFVQEDGTWRPAAGTFPGWPARAAEITVLDPCMGSGHFLVFALDILVALRKAEEGLSEAEAVTAVLSDNLHGLEIDPRCTQIAAFALALAAWKRMGGVRPLPKLHLACSGLPIGMGKDEFVRLAEKIAEAEGFAGGRADLLGRERNPLEERALARRRGGLERLYDLFAQAPVLGSLIDPRGALGDGTLFEEGFSGLAGVLSRVLSRSEGDPEVREAAVTAQGLTKAAELLAGQFTLVGTNVPYLSRSKQSAKLRDFAERHQAHAQSDLATMLLGRFLPNRSPTETVATVSPQNWLFLKRYTNFRSALLRNTSFLLNARLGAGGFETISGEVVNVFLSVISRISPSRSSSIATIDASNQIDATAKAKALAKFELKFASQLDQLLNPDALIQLGDNTESQRVGDFGFVRGGITSGDSARFRCFFWERNLVSDDWAFQQGTVNKTTCFSGRSLLLKWEGGNGEISRRAGGGGATIAGRDAWGRQGVAITYTGGLQVTIYTGEIFENVICVLVARDEKHAASLWSYCESEEFARSVRSVNQKMSVDVRYFEKAPYDSTRWEHISTNLYPNGLPKPYSNDPTQWLLDGHPRGSADPNTPGADGNPTRPGLAEHPLQVAVARLLGYRWPRQTGSSFMDCPAIDEPDEIDRAGVVDADGIVCLPSLQGEPGAAERVRAVLRAAWWPDWGEGVVRTCLEAEGWDKDLDSWLADGFFDGHCKLFHQTPFVWHVWDGMRGGFSTLVNYHKLCAPDGAGRRLLEKLRDTYLGEWISAQHRAVASGDATAEDRLAAAEHLRGELTKIIEGEPPYDIFVRWKALHEQPIGWEPDIDDGVRLNIRPFLTARPWRARAKKASILRVTPGLKKHAGADRGGEPFREKDDYPWFWAEEHDVATVDFAGGEDFKGRRYNDFHYTRAFKQAARDRKAKGGAGSEAAE